MATVTTGNIVTGSAALRRYIESQAIRVFKKNTFFLSMGEQRTLPVASNKYAFNLPSTASFNTAAATLTEGTVPTEQAFTFDQKEVSMTQYGVFAKLSDVVLRDSPIDVYAEAGYELGRRLAEVVDTVVQNVLDGNGVAGFNDSGKITVVYGGAATSRATVSSAMTATAAKLAEISAKLQAQAVPTIDGAYVAIVHPYVVKDLITESTVGGFFEVSKYSQPENIFNGEIGKLYGIRIVVAPNNKVYTGAGVSSANVYPTFIMGKYAYGTVKATDLETIIQPVGSAGAADPLKQFGTVGLKMRFGSTLLKSEALARLETASSIG